MPTIVAPDTGQADSQHYRYPGIAARLRRDVQRQGAIPVFGRCARWASGYLAGLPWTVRGSRGAFELGSERYAYAFRRHNWTWLNERAVEIPIGRRHLSRHAGRRVLEVGNVLSHYDATTHLVVDRYERGPRVLNTDAAALRGVGPFDLILSISTLEHVGWDEYPRAPGKAVAALEHLRSLLAPGGLLIVTVPAGYNPTLDAFLLEQGAESRLRALVRGPGSRWRETAPEIAAQAPYDWLLYTAGAIFVAQFERPALAG